MNLYETTNLQQETSKIDRPHGLYERFFRFYRPRFVKSKSEDVRWCEQDAIAACKQRYKSLIESWDNSSWEAVGYDAAIELWMLRVRKHSNGKKHSKTHFWIIDATGKSYKAPEITAKYTAIEQQGKDAIEAKAAEISRWDREQVATILTVSPEHADYERQITWLKKCLGRIKYRKAVAALLIEQPTVTLSVPAQFTWKLSELLSPKHVTKR